MIDPPVDRRTDFLIAMYGAMWQNINRHILVVWHSIAALFTAVAAAFLGDKGFLSPDYAFSIVILASAWSAAHALDANSWFNRNLVIIGNIERQFLLPSDVRDVHYYFSQEHRSGMVDHLRIQFILASAIFFLALAFHLATRVLTDATSAVSSIALSLPYITAALSLTLLTYFAIKGKRAHDRLLERSPGIPVAPSSASGVEGRNGA